MMSPSCANWHTATLMSDLTGRSAIITGAASGIGRAIAIRFAEAGAHVVVADLEAANAHGGTATHEAITMSGGSARFIRCDVSDRGSVDALVEATVAQYGRLDIVVNNAAISAGKSLLDTTDEDWNRVLAVNLTGPFLVCRAAVAQMLEQPLRGEVRGRIVNISSQHGMIAAPQDCAYGTSKSGVAYLTRQIAADYARHGIVCNAVAPGKIENVEGELRSDRQRWEYSTSRTPWPRLGRPGDVASAALFLACDESTYVTGVNLMVDGGWMAS